MNLPFSLTALAPLDGESVLSLDAAKDHVRVIDADQDGLIGALRDAALAHIEDEAGVALVQRQFKFVASEFPARDIWRIDLPMHPVSVQTVEYLHPTTGAVTLMPAEDWHFGQGYLEPGIGKCWPAVAALSGAVIITYTAGDTVPPAALIAAAKLMLEHLYTNRGSEAATESTTLPKAIAALINNHRRVIV